LSLAAGKLANGGAGGGNAHVQLAAFRVECKPDSKGECKVRKVIFAINTTLDGVCDHTKGIPDDELYPYYANIVRAAGVLAYGRKTYELMVPYWPDKARNPSADSQGENDFAQAFIAVEKMVVFSTQECRVFRCAIAGMVVRLLQSMGGFGMRLYLKIGVFHYEARRNASRLSASCRSTMNFARVWVLVQLARKSGKASRITF
jgi:hypothetical protein